MYICIYIHIYIYIRMYYIYQKYTIVIYHFLVNILHSIMWPKAKVVSNWKADTFNSRQTRSVTIQGVTSFCKVSHWDLMAGYEYWAIFFDWFDLLKSPRGDSIAKSLLAELCISLDSLKSQRGQLSITYIWKMSLRLKPWHHGCSAITIMGSRKEPGQQKPIMNSPGAFFLGPHGTWYLLRVTQVYSSFNWVI